MGGPPDRANLTPKTPGCGRPGAGPRDCNPALSCQPAPVGPGEARRRATLRSDPGARPDLQPGQTRRTILGPTAALGPPRGTCGPSPRSLRFAPPPTILQRLRHQQVLWRARAPANHFRFKGRQSSPPAAARTNQKRHRPKPASKPARGRGPAYSACLAGAPSVCVCAGGQADPPERLVFP